MCGCESMTSITANNVQIVHAGKRLCLLKAVLKREKDGAVISSCEHQKYNIDADMPVM